MELPPCLLVEVLRARRVVGDVFLRKGQSVRDWRRRRASMVVVVVDDVVVDVDTA